MIYIKYNRFIGLCLLVLFVNVYGHQTSRRRFTLNDVWRFKRMHIDGAQTETFDDSGWEIVNLPHTWNAADVEDEIPGYYRGVAWYRKRITLDDSYKHNRIFLYFEGANQVTELYVNGQHAGNHIGGYASFCFDITKFINLGENNKLNMQLAVKVDNSYHDDIPTLTADFTFFGGIYRDVYVVASNQVHFDMLDYGSSGIYIETPEVSSDKAWVRIRGKAVNESAGTKDVHIAHLIRDPEGQVVSALKSNFNIESADTKSFTEEKIVIHNPRLWSPDSPALYTVCSKITDVKTGELLDEVINPLGFRWFEFHPKKGFFLNGKQMKLFGANRHQDYLDLGNALPDELHYRDIQLLKEMGANCLRIAHYQQDPVILEACDRLGILVTEEIPIVNTITETKAFADNCKNMIIEMVRRDFNHPSVIVWAYMNEVLLRPRFETGSDRQEQYFTAVRDLAQDLENIIRREDPRRYTMIPNHGDFELYHRTGLTRIPKIVGWNLYYGWYARGLEGFNNFVDHHHRVLPDKPVIISEYGAGADPRKRTFHPRRFDFSMEWQNRFHAFHLESINERPFIAGGFVWNFVDFSSESRVDAVPHVNNKGLVTRDRKPKDSYYDYKAHLSREPVLCLASKLWRIRGGRADEPEDKTCSQPVEVYSNLEEVELRINGRPLGKQVVKGFTVIWDVPFENGINILEAWAEYKGNVYQDRMEVDFRLLPFQLNASKIPWQEICINVGSHCFFVDELRKQIWLPDQPYKDGSWGFVGGEQFINQWWVGETVGTEADILGTQLDPVYQTQRIGLEAYRFDVPDGAYELTLCFSQIENRDRPFNVMINDGYFIKELNLLRDYGLNRAVSFRFDVAAENREGIEIAFSASKGVPVLNGIKIRRMN